MTSPSPHPTEQLSSLLTPGENPGSFQQDWVPYEPMIDRQVFTNVGQKCDDFGPIIGSVDHPMIPMKDEPWPARVVSDEDKRSDTYLRSHMQGLEDCLTRLDQRMQRIESLMSQLLEAMADGDEQDEPRTYMDGSPV